MITENKLRELLTRSESSVIDFKSEPHRLDNDHFTSEFVKDILAMANTPRNETAYIVIGVKLHQDGSKEYRGVNTHPDDSDLQDKLNLARVEPKPTFVYQPMNLEGKSYGVIEIPLVKTGPYFATKDFPPIKANRLYFRRGTKNDEATIGEQGDIYKWFHGETANSSSRVLDIQPTPNSNWDKFYLACHKFDPGHHYLLILGPGTHKNLPTWEFAGRLPLSLVLDFDPETEQDGVYALASTTLNSNRSVHLLSFEDQYTLVPEKACYWYAAKGLSGRAKSLVNDDWREWNRKYAQVVRKLIDDFARASGGRPLTVICLWYAPEYVREVCSAIDRTFGDYASYIFAIPDAERVNDLANQFKGEAVSLRPEDILYGIAQHIKPTIESTPYAGIPDRNGIFQLLSLPDIRWLSEDLVVVHSNIELENLDSARQPGSDFLKGAVISWADLNSHFDADRDATSQILKQIENELESRTTARLNLYHWPGAGGTTIARRLAWELRRRYPTVLLRRVTTGETVGRFRKLFQLTGQPLLAIMEGADAVPDELEHLYTEVKAEQIPAVFVSVLRRYDTPKEGQRIIFLGAHLSISESYRFAEAYKRITPQKAPQIQRILESPSDRERTPFHFALTAFGRDYIGLTKYVEARLQTATQTQKELVTFLSLAYFYGHKSVLPQVFATHLGFSENRPVQLEKILGELQIELLVKENDGKWRPAHQLIAEEICQIVLSGNSEEKRNWKRGLSAWSLQFIKNCSKGSILPNDDVIDLMRRVFILRDEHDLLGTESSASSQFALLIEHIQTLEGRLSVLKELVDSFPYESHFWGHLGRFYSSAMDEPNKALEALGKAVELSPEDPVLRHMQGMTYRKLAYAQMKEENRQRQNISDDQIQETVTKAKEAFAEARNLDPDSEHAHISPIQLLLRVLDYGYNSSGCNSRADFLVSRNAVWYREQLDEIENLLERVKGLREGEKFSKYIVDCDARLQQVYDNYSRALEGWNDLLSRQDVFAPPVRRQIVRAYLTRQKREWDALTQKEIERIVDLMEDNMREEPFSDHNIRLWFRAIRFSTRQDVDIALDKIANWKALGDSLEAYYYLYILHVLKAMDGSMIERVRSEELIQMSRTRARNQRNRTRSFEWFGKGNGLKRLKHYSELGEWTDSLNFYENTAILERVEGRIIQINGPEAGLIEVTSCGLNAFFVPAVADLYKGRDENRRVSFYLGFSYDGLRAWSVRAV